MEEMGTGYAIGPTDVVNRNEGAGFHDLTWMLLLIAAMYGGDELKEVMVNAVMEKVKEGVECGKQLIREYSSAVDENRE